MTEKSPLQIQVHRNMVKFLVSKSITCMRSGEILDCRTCVVILDADGDPQFVLAQAGWASLVADHVAAGTDAREALAKVNLTVDEDTVK